MKDDTFRPDECAIQLKALSEPIRLRIVDILRHGEMTVGDIAEFLECEFANVSHHLNILKNAKLVEAHREGRFIHYGLRKDLVQKSTRNRNDFLNLNCCRIEVPQTTDSGPKFGADAARTR